MAKNTDTKDKGKIPAKSKEPRRQAAKFVSEKKPRKQRYGPNRKARSVMIDEPTMKSYLYLEQVNTGGFNLTRWFNRALQAEAIRQGYIPPPKENE